MKPTTAIALILIFALQTSSAESPPDPQQYRAWTQNLKRRDAVAEAKKNFKNGEIYVISVMGFALMFPGLDQRVGFRLKEKYGSKHIKWTSDAVGNEVEKAYFEAVGKYASDYNRETMRLLKERGDE